MIVVFDSNVWVSALRFRGIPLRALETAVLDHTIAICPEIESEVVRILSQKFLQSAQKTKVQVNNFLEFGLRVSISGSLKGICRDPNDDMVVECALRAGAQKIVSGDKDLLALRSYSEILIQTPSQFLAELQAMI